MRSKWLGKFALHLGKRYVYSILFVKFALVFDPYLFMAMYFLLYDIYWKLLIVLLFFATSAFCLLVSDGLKHEFC